MKSKLPHCILCNEELDSKRKRYCHLHRGMKDRLVATPEGLRVSSGVVRGVTKSYVPGILFEEIFLN